MGVSTPAVAHLLAALAAPMVTAHTCGAVLTRFRQPRVIGEIAAGLVLGPTLLGHLAPDAEAWLFPATGAGSTARRTLAMTAVPPRSPPTAATAKPLAERPAR